MYLSQINHFSSRFCVEAALFCLSGIDFKKIFPVTTYKASTHEIKTFRSGRMNLVIYWAIFMIKTAFKPISFVNSIAVNESVVGVSSALTPFPL
jgi:hypothetical protein